MNISHFGCLESKNVLCTLRESPGRGGRRLSSTELKEVDHPLLILAI